MQSARKPPVLLVNLVARCAFSLTGYWFVPRGAERVRISIVSDAIFILFGYRVLFFYWRGRNWARILVLLTSLLSIFNLFLLSRPHAFPRQAVIVGEAVLGVFLIYWLNTREAKEFFTPVVRA